MAAELVPADIITVAALALPHLLYAYIWFLPHHWQAAFQQRSVLVFESIAWVLKGVQFLSMAYWYLAHSPGGLDLGAVSPLQWAAALLLGGAGQVLNLAIFRAIGGPGVYYGFKLGVKVPWVEGFPFNVVAHPQYVGSVLTVWALAALLWTQAPAGLGLLCVYWTLLYVITGLQESSWDA